MSSLSRFAPWVAAALLGAAQLPNTLAQDSVCTPIEDTLYQSQIIVSDGFEIRWGVDEDAGTISFEVVNSATSWTAVGFSSDGNMIGSDAVIGLPNDGTVLEYELTAKSLEGVTPFDTADQEISGESVSQDSGTTTLTFTRLLNPDSPAKQTLFPIPEDTVFLLWASGVDNELDNHGEDNRGTVEVDIFCGTSGTPSPSLGGTTFTSAPTLTPGGGPGSATSEPTTTMSPADGTEAPTSSGTPLGGTAAPTDDMTVDSTMAPSPSATGDRGIPPIETTTMSPTAAGMDTTASPTSGDSGVGSPTPTPSEGGETDRAFRVGGGGWVAAVTGLAAVLLSATMVSW